jgi:DNA-binding response OmpR family regulator
MLLDLGLPDVGGLDLMPLLADRGTSVPTIIVTARSDPRDRATALRHGAHDYLTKPLTADTVARAVRACLAHHPPPE